MFNLSGSKKAINAVSKKTDKSKKKLKKTKQASKKQSRETIDLLIIKKIFSKKISTGILLLSVIISMPFVLPANDLLPIGKIKVSGNFEQINLKDINRQLKTHIGKGFFSVDIKFIQKELSFEPWVETVSVSRVWPNQLHVYINERKAVARWDREQLLSNHAIIFKAASEDFKSLPLINGYSGQSKELLKRFRNMQQVFLNRGISISEMIEDSKGALSLVLNNKLKVNIGSDNNKLKIKHLLAVYPLQIKPRLGHIKHIDFRYSNGFAIAWTDEYLQQQSGEKMNRGNKNV